MCPRSVLIAALIAAAPAFAQPWKNLDFLIGKWTGVAGEKDTPLGAGQGDFSFEPQLNQKIIVRHNLSKYDSGARHDDLMVIYLDPPNDAPRAIYFDSEGHVIRYNVTFPAPNSVIFESDASQPAPRYRLSYTLEQSTLAGKFEVAPPGSSWRPYMTWKSRRN
jgi:hypothetical protein